MNGPLGYEKNKHGGSEWASESDVAPFLRGHGPQLGYFNKRPLKFGGDGPILTFGGAGSSKGAAVIIPILLGADFGSKLPPTLVTDPSGQNAAVTHRQQARLGRSAFVFNPMALHKGLLPQHRCNPWGFLKRGSPTLFADCSAVGGWVVERSGGGEARFWEEYTSGMVRFATFTRAVLTGGTSIPDCWKFMQRLSTDSAYFRQVVEELTLSPHANAEMMRDARELYELKTNNEKMWVGMMSTLKNAIGMSADPLLEHALTGDDFSPEVLVNPKLWPGKKPPVIYYCIPGEQKEEWRAITRCFIGAAMLQARRRADMAIRPYFLIDEAGSLGNTPLITTAMSEDRKYYRFHAIFQSIGQPEKHFGQAGAKEIFASATVRQFVGVRDLQTAELVSAMLGKMTLEHVNPKHREEHKHKVKSALRAILLYDVPILETWLHALHDDRQAHQVEFMARPLLTPSEVLTMPEGLQVIFVVGTNPILAQKLAYYLDPLFQGKFDPDPFHPTPAKKGLMALFG